MRCFHTIGWLDTWGLAAKAYAERAQFTSHPIRNAPGSPQAVTKSIMLREPVDDGPDAWFADVEHRDTETLKSWRSARAALATIKTMHNEVMGIGKVMIVSLPAGGVIPWHMDRGDYYQAHWRIHVPLFTNPGVMMSVGNESLCMLTGLVTAIANTMPHTCINTGTSERVHLIVDLRKPDHMIGAPAMAIDMPAQGAA